VDVDERKIAVLRSGGIPIYEPGLAEMVRGNSEGGRMDFHTSLESGLGEAQVVFIAVGTPTGSGGAADVSMVHGVAREIGQLMRTRTAVVIKSTVPVGTARRVEEIIASVTDQAFAVVSNPEFLREGRAIADFMEPDRTVVGTDELWARETMESLYRPLVDERRPVLFMGNASAEMVKYAANAFLATKISFINEVANLCDRIHANVDHVRRGIGTDQRIGTKFLNPGIGYGGSCFPKDVRAMIDMGRRYSYPMRICEAVESVNNEQKTRLASLMEKHYRGELAGKHVAVWGTSFKPQTDDMREAPSVIIIDRLLERGATVCVFDPEALENVRESYGDRIAYAEDMWGVLEGANALAICTEWNAFLRPDFPRILATMGDEPVIFDGRNIYDPAVPRSHGFTYYSIGRK
jgi:UDPglucose 6-dehydrogenase